MFKIFKSASLSLKNYFASKRNILSLLFLCTLSLLVITILDFVASGAVVGIDLRVNALFYALRNAWAVKIFLGVTFLGEVSTIIVFTLVVSLLLWLSRKKWEIIAFLFTIIGSEGSTFLAKIIFHRPRPSTAVFLENSNSFPSGHATIAVAFYGFLIYLLFNKIKGKVNRVLFFLVGFIVILAIGFSRLYLGVHYLSDVGAGYLVGSSWLILGIGFNEWKKFQNRTANK